MADEEVTETVEVTEEVTPQVSEAEALAIERGWVSKEKWKGEPPKSGKFFETAESFNEHHEKSNHKVKLESQRLRDEMAQMRIELESFNGFAEKLEARSKRELESKILSLRDELDGAVRTGDQVRAQRIMEETTAIKAEISAPAMQAEAAQSNANALQAQFNVANPWYDEQSPDFNQQRYNTANEIARQLLDSGRKADAAFFADIASQTDMRHAPKPRAASKVEAPSRVSRKAKKVTEWGQMPAEARKRAEEGGFLRFYGGDKDKYAQSWAKDQEQAQ